MIKIYGSPMSSAGRCYLLLEELGVPYETVPLDMRNREHKSPEYLKLNPNGKVPCLVDGDFVIWESVAINQYLVAKYKPEWMGKTPQEMGLVQQWNTWAMLELQPPLVEMLIQLMFVPEDKRDMNVIKAASEKVPPRLTILEGALKGKTTLVGSSLTVADFNLASVVNLALALKVSIDSFPALKTWFNSMKSRPSFQKFAERTKH